jgi:hypothetical protein
MAIANNTQILIDSNKRTVIKRIGIIDSDETLTVIIDPRTLSGALNANNLPYQAGNTVAPGFGNVDTNPQYQLPAITNNAIGPTGNVVIKTVGTTANAAYTLIIELHKNNSFFDAGWGRDPAAFNYGEYSITPHA